MVENKFNKKKQIRVNPPTSVSPPPPIRFKEESKKIANEEAKKQLAKLQVNNQSGDNWQATLAEISDDLKTATTPDGQVFNAVTIGGQPGKVAPFFKISDSLGAIYTPEVDTVFTDSSQKPGYILERRYDGVYIRQVGNATGFKVPITIPDSVLSGEFSSHLQAMISANCKHFMVGWWLQNKSAPYETRAYYTVFSDFKFNISNVDHTASLTIGNTQSFSTNLNELADGQAVPPQQNEIETALNIWFLWPGNYTGYYAKFTPTSSAFYNTSTPSYPDFVCAGLYVFPGTSSSAQNGHLTVKWVLDPNTLAVFTDVKFAFNNDITGNPIVDIVTAWKGVTVGYLDSLSSYDEQDYFFNGGGLVGTQTCRYSQNQNNVKYEYTYDYDYPYIPPENGLNGRGYMRYTYENKTDFGKDIFVRTDGTNGGLSITYYERDPRNAGTCCEAYDLTLGTVINSDSDFCEYFARTGYIGSQCLLGFGFSDVYENKFTTYAGQEGLGGEIQYPPTPFFPYLTRCCFFTAGYYNNFYWYGWGAAASAFANAYYFVRAQMIIRNANLGGNVSFVGRLPTIEFDYDTIDTAFRGANGNTAMVYYQHASLYEITRPDYGNDSSVQALLDILRESGLEEVADYLEEHPELFGDISGQPQTNTVHWWCSAYGADPYFGYLQKFDVITDRIVSPQGSFPFQFRYIKGIDSFAVVAYNIYNGNEQVILFQVGEDGNTKVSSLASKPDPGAGYEILDVGIKYGH